MTQHRILTKRDHSIDYVKFFACFSVIAVHFRHNLQDQISFKYFGSKTSLFMSVIYQFFITCVPLFLIASGYLMTNKTYSWKYYKNIAKIVTIYLLSSLISYFLLHYFLKTTLSFSDILFKLQNFTLLPYSWYIEMYVGLALFIPFLTIFVQRTNKRELLYLILSLIIIVTLPTLINSNPKLNTTLHLPSFWINLYPIVYYLIGAAIRTYYINFKPKTSQLAAIIFLYLITLSLGIYINYSNANPKVLSFEGGNASLIIVLQALSQFLLIRTFFHKKQSLITFISNLTLPIFLMSYPVDQIVYPYLLSKVDRTKQLFPFAPVIVITIFILSILLAFIVNQLNNLLWKLTPFIYFKKLMYFLGFKKQATQNQFE